MISYPYILGIIDKINEWNTQLNEYASNHLDNVWIGIAILGAIILVAVLGINKFGKS